MFWFPIFFLSSPLVKIIYFTYSVVGNSLGNFLNCLLKIALKWGRECTYTCFICVWLMCLKVCLKPVKILKHKPFFPKSLISLFWHTAVDRTDLTYGLWCEKWHASADIKLLLLSIFCLCCENSTLWHFYMKVMESLHHSVPLFIHVWKGQLYFSLSSVVYFEINGQSLQEHYW